MPDINYCFKRRVSASILSYDLLTEQRNVFRQAHKSTRVIHLDSRGRFPTMPTVLNESSKEVVEAIIYCVRSALSTVSTPESFGLATFPVQPSTLRRSRREFFRLFGDRLETFYYFR